MTRLERSAETDWQSQVDVDVGLTELRAAFERDLFEHRAWCQAYWLAQKVSVTGEMIVADRTGSETEGECFGRWLPGLRKASRRGSVRRLRGTLPPAGAFGGSWPSARTSGLRAPASRPGIGEIAVSDGERTTATRDMGLVSQVFDCTSLAALGTGHLALGHVRYSTTSSASWENAQPEFGGRGDVNVAVAHNGNLVNAGKLTGRPGRGGFQVLSTSDTTYIAAAAVRELERGALSGKPSRRPGATSRARTPWP